LAKKSLAPAAVDATGAFDDEAELAFDPFEHAVTASTTIVAGRSVFAKVIGGTFDARRPYPDEGVARDGVGALSMVSKGFWSSRAAVVLVEVVYLLVLFTLAIVYLTDPNPASALHKLFPAMLGSLPIGVAWFGALGAVVISLSGAFDHRKDWDPDWSLWHFTRPLMGISLAIVACLIFQSGVLAANPSAGAQLGNASGAGAQAPQNLLYYLIAFVVGYREEVFRELIKRVADVLLTPSQPSGAASAAVSALAPNSGPAGGGSAVKITGSGLAGTTAVAFGAAAARFAVDSDSQILATAPQSGAPGPVAVTVSTKTASISAGEFTYT
jgi:hypothetical protein